MKLFTHKSILFFLASLVTSTNALAHDYDNVLAAQTSATDYIQITCNDSVDHLFFRLRSIGSASSPIVSAEVSKDGVAKSITDPSNTDKAYSDSITVKAGGGVYHITVHKSKQGKAKYSFEDHCYTSDGVHPDYQPSLTIEHKR